MFQLSFTCASHTKYDNEGFLNKLQNYLDNENITYPEKGVRMLFRISAKNKMKTDNSGIAGNTPDRDGSSALLLKSDAYNRKPQIRYYDSFDDVNVTDIYSNDNCYYDKKYKESDKFKMDYEGSTLLNIKSFKNRVILCAPEQTTKKYHSQNSQSKLKVISPDDCDYSIFSSGLVCEKKNLNAMQNRERK